MLRTRLRLGPTGAFVFAAAMGSNGCRVTDAAVQNVPRLEDRSAPRDFYEQVHPSEQKCDHEVAMFAPGTMPGQPYTEVSSLSATCSPGAIQLCERRMKERACALGADAVLLLEPTAGPTPTGASGQRIVSRSGRAIRWRP